MPTHKLNDSDGNIEMADIAAAQGKARGGAAGLISKVFAFGGVRFLVLMILCLQNSMFTVLRRYSLGVLKEEYSKVSEKRKTSKCRQMNKTCHGPKGSDWSSANLEQQLGLLPGSTFISFLSQPISSPS